MALDRDRNAGTDPGRRRKCHNCESFISRKFARVFGDNDDRAHACIECSTLHSLRDGEASGPE